MKKTLFTLVLLAVMGFVSAQSLQFEWDGNVYNDGDAIECVNDEFGFGEYIQHMQIRNLTSADLNVIVEKEVLEDLEGVMNFFCWGSCFSPDVFVSPRPVTVEANSVTGEEALSFHALYDGEVYGYLVMRYYAYDESNPDERVSIIVKFHRSGEGVAENAIEFGHAYPNPASSMVSFDYALSSGDKVSVSVYNLLGQEVMGQQLNNLQGKVSFSVADLNEGIYFCNLFVNGCAVKTEKFVVKK